MPVKEVSRTINLGLALLLIVSSGFASQPEFTTIDVPGFVGNTNPLGINARGQVVGGVFDPSTHLNHGFLFDNGTFTIIDVPGGTNTQARGINSRGQIVGFYFIGLERHGFLLDHGTFTTIDVPGATGTQPAAINDQGQIIGISSTGVFLLDHGVYSIVTALQDATGINNAGQIVGATSAGSGVLAKGTFTTINVPGALLTRPFGINESGEIAGFYFSQTQHGFVFDGTTFTTIDVPGATSTEATGINARGQVVGFYDDSGGTHGFIRNP